MDFIMKALLLFFLASMGTQGTDARVVFPPRVTSPPVFRCDYTYDDGVSGWYKVHKTPVTLDEAQHICSKEGSQILIRGVSLQQAQSLMKKVPVNKIHTGLMMPLKQAQLLTRTVSVTDMTTQKPAMVSGNNRHTGLMHQPDSWRTVTVTLDSEGFLNHTPSLIERYPFICHKKKELDDVPNECGTFDTDYQLDSRTGKCYKFHRTESTWDTAYSSCIAEGGHLAIINSLAEGQVLHDLFERNPASLMEGVDLKWRDTAFIGVRSWDNGATWMTVDGQEIHDAGYAVFSEGEPNNARGDEYCGSIGRNAQLFDDPCNRRMPYICEKDTKDIVCNDIEDRYNEYIIVNSSDGLEMMVGKTIMPTLHSDFDYL